MSIHGNQFVLPFIIKKSIDSPSIYEDMELALVFYILTKDLKKNEKIISFSRLLWPFLSIQGVISTHIILGGLDLFSKKGRFSNPPRQPLIGHILRNVDEKTKIGVLNRSVDILTYKDIEAEEIGAGIESEYRSLIIDNLVNPEIFQSLLKLIPYVKYQPITDFSPLDSNLTIEAALDISEKYRSIIDTIRGNALRWETQTNLIRNEVNKWITNLTVEIKDCELRYQSQISKIMEKIDSNQIRKQKEIERDKIDLWKVNEKKNLIENIIVLFKAAETKLQEIIKKNRFFSSNESLKTKVFEDIIPSFEKQFTYLKDEGKKFLDSIESLNQKFKYLKEQSLRIDSEAKMKLEEIETTLNKQLQDRDKQLSEFEREKEENISKLKKFQSQIENLFEKINEIVQTKKKNCEQEAEELIGWSIKDTQLELFAKPIQWFYMPLYAMFIENEDLMEERMNVVFPGYAIKYTKSPYEDLSESIVELKVILNERIEDDVRIRSNFEFSCGSKNLIKDPNIKEKIQLGFSKLRNKSFFNAQIEEKIIENLNLFS